MAVWHTLQAAFGTWPSDRAFDIGLYSEAERSQTSGSGLNERFSFGDKSSEPRGFRVTSKYFPDGKVFVPPYFVPPEGDAHDSARPQDVSSHSLPVLTRRGPSSERRLRPIQPMQPAPEPQTHDSRTPSPDSDARLSRERERNWSDQSRRAFHAMLTGPGYVNRYRLETAKLQRLMYHLQHPDDELLNHDGTKDHQTRYQASHWTLRNGKLYRKPESGRVGHQRRHLDAAETWDVLTAEHLRSGHMGRDKFRKVLERRYIGYTLQEIMFVAKECRKCGAKENKGVTDAPLESPAMNQQLNQDATTTEPSGPYVRKQTSNFMWF